MTTRHRARAPRAAAAALGALLGATSAAPPAHAQTVDTTATVILQGRADPRDGKVYTVVPLYEGITVGASDFKLKYVDDFKINLQGWAMQSFGDPRPDINFDVTRPFPNGAPNRFVAAADVDVAFIEGKLFNRHLAFRVGRQLVMGGAARITQLDGASLDWRIVKGLGLTIYGGVPVTPRFGFNRGDLAAGARLYYRFNFESELGVSAIDVLGLGRAARQDAAADLRVAFHRTFYLTAYGLYSLKELRLGEASGALNWQPVSSFLLTAEYRRVAPDLFLPMNSIFAVFSQETRDEMGATLYWQPVKRLRLSGDYRAVGQFSDGASWGHRGGVKATLAIDKGVAAGVELRALHLPTNGYYQARLFGTERTGNFFFSLDVDGYYLENAILSQNYSFSAAATAGWDFSPGWKLAVTGMGDVTPFVERRYEMVARLVWNQTVRIREVK